MDANDRHTRPLLFDTLGRALRHARRSPKQKCAEGAIMLRPSKELQHKVGSWNAFWQGLLAQSRKGDQRPSIGNNQTRAVIRLP
jgi:hypothetical protein